MHFVIVLLLSLSAVMALAPAAATAEPGRLAFVQKDASLRIGIRTVRLFGIYVPHTNRTCVTKIRPARCGSRAALALDFKVQGFVYCRYLGHNGDGSYSALCEVDCKTSPGRCREDLGAWMISEGWAVAAPGATDRAPLSEKTLYTVMSKGSVNWDRF